MNIRSQGVSQESLSHQEEKQVSPSTDNTVKETVKKDYSYSEVEQLFLAAIKKYNLDKSNILFSHMLLKFSGIDTFPEFAEICESFPLKQDEHHSDARALYFGITLPYSDRLAFIEFYNQKFGEKSCVLDTPPNWVRKWYALQINAVAKAILSDEFKTVLDAHLSDQQVLHNYRVASSDAFVSLWDIHDVVDELGSKYDFSSNSNFYENALCHAFGYSGDIRKAQWQDAAGFDVFATHTAFFLEMPAAAAENLVLSLNAFQDNCAYLVAQNTNHPNLGDANVQVIAIKNSVLISALFKEKLELALRGIINEKPALIQIFCREVRDKPTAQELSDDLDSLVKTYGYHDSDEHLYKALTTLSLFNRENKSKAEIQTADAEVKKALTEHTEKHLFFKIGEKAKVSCLEREILKAAEKRMS